MEIEFIGVGEAFDPSLGNASYLVKSKTNMLIDCGYAVPRNFFERKHPADLVDILYLTHFHADHGFGIPALFFRWSNEKRSKPLFILGQNGTENYIDRLLEIAYPGMRSKISFELSFLEREESFDFNELSLHFAETYHPMKNYAIRIEAGNKSAGFSGDGALTPASRQLFQPCHVLVHEAFCFEKDFPGHTTAKEVMAYAEQLPKLETLALVHLQRDEREQQWEKFQDLQQKASFSVLIPEPGDVIKV